jgi:thiamine pyrophosphokinase
VEKRILGILGGRDLTGGMFKLWAQSAHILIAADTGADSSIEQGVRPDAIVGDMDSISPSALASGIDLYRIDDQNHTDCDKLLELAHSWGHSEVTLIGVEGDRLDHLMATLHSCARTPLRVRLAVRDGLGHVLGPGTHRIPTIPGRRISFLPLIEVSSLTVTGVRWPLQAADLSIGNFISISNLAEEPICDIQFESGHLLVLQEIPHDRLPIWPDQDGLAILGT